MRLNGSVVVATNLVVAYGDRVALDRSSFSVPAGSTTALIGPNGSGKSTVLNAIAGLIAPVSGELYVGAERNRISYVLQGTKVNEVLPITVREVVTMGRYAGRRVTTRLRGEDRTAVNEAMERMGLSDLASLQLFELSAGQRQRVFVAQGLAQDHDLLLLDEPLTGLDLTSARAIDEVIHEEHTRGCTVLMTTHDLAEARVADYVLLLGGRVIAAGPPLEVLTTDTLAEAYGPTILHVDGGEVFIDDPAHMPVPGRHVHRERGA